MASYWNNDDGLAVSFGPDKSVNKQHGGVVSSNGSSMILTYRFDYTDLPSFTTDINNDGTLNGFSLQDVGVPAGASVKEVILRVGTAWASGTSLAVGAYDIAGNALDADGYVTAAQGATSNLTIGSVITGSGSDISENVSASLVGYTVVVAVGTFTTGDAVLTIEYMI